MSDRRVPTTLSSQSQWPQFEVIEVDQKRVGCDGGGGSLGHPRVWLNLGEDNRVACTYCSRLYVMRGTNIDPDASTEPQ